MAVFVGAIKILGLKACSADKIEFCLLTSALISLMSSALLTHGDKISTESKEIYHMELRA